MATIVDVAKRAQVSISTVSYALSGRRQLKKETRDRIRKLADELGYVPSAIGTALATGKTHTIGITVTNVSSSLVGDVLAGIEEVTWEHKYSLILCNTYEDEKRELQAIETLMGKKVDGMILVTQSSAWADLKILRRLRKQEIPIVAVNREIDPSLGQSVIIDNFGGAHRATSYLASLGHRRIGFITGPRGRLSSIERLKGYKAALKDGGIAVDNGLIVRGVYGEKGLQIGYAAARELLKQTKAPTAIFASTDNMAIGVMKAVIDHGKRVPEDVAVIGFDNTNFSELVSPPLTSVAMPMREAGNAAAKMLFSALGNGGKTRSPVTVDCTLMVRESTGTNRSAGSRGRQRQ